VHLLRLAEGRQFGHAPSLRELSFLPKNGRQLAQVVLLQSQGALSLLESDSLDLATNQPRSERLFELLVPPAD